jgi:hypothetical protein
MRNYHGYLVFILCLFSSLMHGQVKDRWRVGVNLGYGLHGQLDSNTPYHLTGAYRFGVLLTSKESQTFQTTLHIQSFSERFKSEVNEGTYIKQFYGGARIQVDVRLRMNAKQRLVVGIAPLLVGRPNAQIEVRNSSLTTSNSFSGSINAAQFNPSYQKFNASIMLGWSYRYKDIIADVLVSYDALPILKEPIVWTDRVEGFPIKDTYTFQPRPIRLEFALNFLIITNRTKRS